ncbi:MAG: hypothetical protein JO002_14855 [Burkholderiaceae bacterium]|nr:hypothetical protein [Burkholderiaceae bacterium]
MNPRLPESIEEAQLLLAYASRNGIALDPATINVVVAAGNKITAGTMGEADEAAFWPAFETLAAKVSPVTVLSLRAIMDVRTTKHHSFPARLFKSRFSEWSVARRAVLWYTMLAVVSLALLLVVQIYWLFGLSIQSDLQEDKAAYEKATAALVTAKPEERNKLDDERSTLELESRSDYKLLERWSRPWEDKCDPSKTVCDCASSDAGAYQACLNISRESSAKVVLSILQRYLLPLLYGLLGASVYILRTLSAQIRARTYSEAANIDFRIRLYLGTLGGMVSAWLISPEVAGGLVKTLSPFAIAFLSGYSVELLFAVMDRIISAFSKPQ